MNIHSLSDHEWWSDNWIIQLPWKAGAKINFLISFVTALSKTPTLHHSTRTNPATQHSKGGRSLQALLWPSHSHHPQAGIRSNKNVWIFIQLVLVVAYNLLVAWRICGKAGKHFTSCARPQKHNLKWNRDQSLPDSKKHRKLIISVNNRLLWKDLPPLVLFSVFPFERAHFCDRRWCEARLKFNLWIIELMAQTH